MTNILAIRVTPRSSRPGIGEWKTDPGGRPFLEVRVAAAPADGAANEEVIALLGEVLGVPRSSLAIAGGHAARLKRIDVPLDDDEIRRRLAIRR